MIGCFSSCFQIRRKKQKFESLQYILPAGVENIFVLGRCLEGRSLVNLGCMHTRPKFVPPPITIGYKKRNLIAKNDNFKQADNQGTAIGIGEF